MAAPEWTNISELSEVKDIPNFPGYCRLKPAYITVNHALVKHPMGNVGDGGDLNHWDCGSGTMTTAPGYEHPIEGEIIWGADWLTWGRDMVYAHPDLRLVVKTDDGAYIDYIYSGIGRISMPILEMFDGDGEAQTSPFGCLVTQHSFRSGNPKYKHLEHKIFVGNGRFIVSHNPLRFSIECRISEVIPSNDLEGGFDPKEKEIERAAKKKAKAEA